MATREAIRLSQGEAVNVTSGLNLEAETVYSVSTERHAFRLAQVDAGGEFPTRAHLLEPRRLHIVEASAGSALWARCDRGEDWLTATEAE